MWEKMGMQSVTEINADYCYYFQQKLKGHMIKLGYDLIGKPWQSWRNSSSFWTELEQLNEYGTWCWAQPLMQSLLWYSVCHVIWVAE